MTRRFLVLVCALMLAACASSAHESATASHRTTTTTTSATPTTSSSTSPAVPEQPAQTMPPASSTPEVAKGIWAEPRAELTPGATDPRVAQDNIDSTICVSGYTTTVRPPSSYTDRVKIDRLAAYGYAQPAYEFELDHLVPLELGGAPYAVANLWPEPWERTGLVGDGWGAETKDSFENYLHRAVCAHRITLADAQRQMATGWIAAAQAVGIAAGAPTVITTTTAAPASTSSGATALCVDGTYSYSAHRSGTCSHHGGVAEWINRPPS